MSDILTNALDKLKTSFSGEEESDHNYQPSSSTTITTRDHTYRDEFHSSTNDSYDYPPGDEVLR